MSKLKAPKVPSLQHLARTWDSDPEKVRRTLVALAKNSPTFSYQLMYELVQDLVHAKIPYEQIEFAIKSRVGRESVRNNFLEILPLVREGMEGIRPSFVHRVVPRHYPLGRGLYVPFSPPFVYGASGVLHMPWFSFWRSNPLSGVRLSLFATIIDEIVEQDPDLEYAEVTILDFSASGAASPRELNKIKLEEIERVDRADLVEMLRIYVSGYEAACRDLEANDYSSLETESENDAQFLLFD
ncbi:hypothetical protein [Stenotrophomonas maltophilia]|uniref:hypothetical protein n=1 Tax=Stenotrophomonas maltophilia TaxID=40324 RepID=UPI00115E7DF8|nr:hypothetical protein [Stenotrophomonas maltophilia]